MNTVIALNIGCLSGLILSKCIHSWKKQNKHFNDYMEQQSMIERLSSTELQASQQITNILSELATQTAPIEVGWLCYCTNEECYEHLENKVVKALVPYALTQHPDRLKELSNQLICEVCHQKVASVLDPVEPAEELSEG